MENLAPTLLASADALASLGGSLGDIDALDDATLLEAQARYSALQRAVQPYGVWIAAAIARRSHHDLGYSGLAKRSGFVSPEALIQSVSGGSRAEAVKFVQLGTMLADVEDAAVEDAAAHEAAVADDAAADPLFEALEPWQAPIARAVAGATLSVDAADSIRKGLSGIEDAAATEDLRRAAETLIGEATVTSADALYRRAREMRDELDAAGIADRERQRRELRYFSAKRRPDGMVGGSYLLSDEDGELMLAIYDRATSPRRGGPRFVNPVDVAEADALLHDPRTPGQIAADAVMALLRVGIDADPGTVFRTRRPAVRVIVTEKARSTRAGHGFFESGGETVSLDTIDRHECEGGIVGVKFDTDGRIVNVGRNQRLFTERQRVGLGVRDGGCRFPGCERPVSWTEAHHINPWARDHGHTNIDDGILLCRLHHMLIHDNHWQVIRHGGEYWLRPPRDLDPHQKLRPMPTRSALMRRLELADSLVE
jgi:hypothetical protein